MNANELMVGDWLQHASGKYFQITRLDMCGDGSVHFACGHPHLWEYNNKFTPIPLTAEILEKNGFQHSMPHNDWTNADCNFYLYEGGNGYRIQNTDIKLDYVHQLQHLLRLCNIDKKDFEL